MPRFLPAAILAVCTMAATGCATMSESECRHADWLQLGERDARQGRTAEHFADRAEACREHGFSADQVAYREGWRRGLEHFCTPDSGFRHGLDGDGYREICPSGRERAFLAGYELGLDIHRAREEMDRLDREMASLEEELAEIDDPDGKEADRIRRSIRELHLDVRRVERGLGRLEAIAAERGFVMGHY